MTYEAFKIILLRDIRAQIPKEERENVRIVSYYKDNRMTDGLTFLKNRESNELTGPLVSVRQLYDFYQAGLGYKEILAKCTGFLEKVQNDEISLEKFAQLAQNPKNITLCAVNTANNKDMLKNIPHIACQDLSVFFRLNISREQDGVQSLVINNLLLDMVGVTKEELFLKVREATQDNYEIKQMSEILHEEMKQAMPEELADILLGDLDGEPETQDDMLVITNKDRMHGAGAIVNPEILNQAARILNAEKIYILPSSVHELIAVPVADGSGWEKRKLLHMVKQVNREAVSPEDKLSDNVYTYDSGTKQLEMTVNPEEIKKQDRNI